MGKESLVSKRLREMKESDIDIIGNCANCGVEYHIHRLSTEQPDYKKKYEKCIEVIKRFDAGIIGMYDL